MDWYNFSQLLNQNSMCCSPCPKKDLYYYIDIARAKGDGLVDIIVVYFKKNNEMKLCNVKRRRQRQRQKINRYGKTGKIKRVTFFATLLQNKLNSDVASFTTCEKKTLQQIGLKVGSKTLNIANELVLHQCCFFFCFFLFFYCSFIFAPPPPPQKKHTFHAQHIFFYVSFPLFCTTTGWNFLVTRFKEELSNVFALFFFFF